MMTKMNLSEITRTANAMARLGAERFGGSPMIYRSAALREAWARARTSAYIPLPSGNSGIILMLMMDPNGVSAETITNATGWRYRVLGGAFAGFRWKHLPVSLEKTEQGNIYKLLDA